MILIAGGGRQGRAIAHKFREWNLPYIIVENDSEIAIRLKQEGFEVRSGDIFNSPELLNNVELLVSALPAKMGEMVYELCIDRGINLVDLSYTEFNPFTIENRVMDSGITILFDTGIAPGLSNLLVGNFAEKLDVVSKIRILVGGIPEKNIPPLGYSITWSPADLIEEYTRPARIKRNGKIITVPSLSGVEEIHWEGIGELEAFYTDGLRSLLHTYSGVPDMEEKTIRYPGHAEKMKFLIDMGFFDKGICTINGISPYRINLCILNEKLSIKVKDILLLRVEVTGLASGEKRSFRAEVSDTSWNEFSAMERTTGFTCACFSRIALEEDLTPGLYPPESLFPYTQKVLKWLAEEDITVRF